MGKHTKEGYSVDALAALMKGQYDELTGRSAANNWRPSKVPSLIMPKNTVPKSVPTQKITRKNGNLKDRGFGSLYEFENYKTKNMMAETQKNLQLANDLMEAANKISQVANPVDKGFPNSINDAFKAPEKKELPSLFEKAQSKKPKPNPTNPYNIFKKTETKTPTKEEVDKALVGRVGKDQLNFSDIKRQDNEESQKKKAQDQAAKELVMNLDFQREVADNPLVNPNVDPIKQFTDENNTQAQLPKFDKKYEKDFEEFFKYRYDQADVRDYDPETDRDVEHWRNLKKDIMRKYGWTEDEFNKKYGEYDNYRFAKMNAEEMSFAKGLSEAHPVAGSALSVLLAPEVAAEGLETAVRGLIGDETYNNLPALVGSDNYAQYRDSSHSATKEKNLIRQTVKENIDSGVGKFAYDLGMGAVDLGTNMALGLGTPVGMGIVSGAQSAAQNEQSALERGVEPEKAARTGLATGVISGIMNTVGLDAVLKGTAKTVAGSILKAAGTEGLENVVEDIADRWLDNVINRENSEKNQEILYYMQNGMSEEEAYRQSFMNFINQELVSAGQGALFGGVLKGGRMAVGLDSVPSLETENIISDATRQVNDARANIEALAQQIPEVPEVITNNVEVPPAPNSVPTVNSDVNTSALPQTAGESAPLYSPSELQEINDYVSKKQQLNNAIQEGYASGMPVEDVMQIQRSIWGMDEYMLQKYPDLFDNGNFRGIPETNVDATVAANTTGVDTTPRVAEAAGESAPVTVYRGYNNSDNPLESNLTRTQSIYDVIGRENPAKFENLPLTYFTESEDVANRYANQNADYLKIMEEDARREYRDLQMQGKKPDVSIDEFARQRAFEKYKTLTGNDYQSNGKVESRQINPQKPLDLSELGEVSTVDDIYKYLSEKTGISELDLDKALLLSDLESDGLDDINVFRLLRNEGNGRVGSRFVDFLRNNGYDSVRYAEDGTNHWALLNNETPESVASSNPTVPEVTGIDNRVPTVVNQTQPVPTQEVPNVGSDVGNVPPTDVGNPENGGNSPHTKTSEAYTNTGKRGGGWNETEYNQYTDESQFQYEDQTERESVTKAIDMINEEGFEGFKDRVMGKERMSASEIDGLMMEWRILCKQARDIEAAGVDATDAWRESVRVFRKVQEQASNNAQALQAMAKWSRNTPEGMLAQAENILNGRTKVEKSAAQKVLDKFQKEHKGFQFSDEFVGEFLTEAEKLKDLDPKSREYKKAMANLGRMVNAQLPAKFSEKLTSFLMDNMLGNFRTLITRNAGGNIGLNAVEQLLERPLAALIDKGLAKKTGRRTQAGLTKAGILEYLQGFGKGLKEEADDFKSNLYTSRSGEVTFEDAIAKNRHVFKEGGLLDRFYDKMVKHGLSIGDRPFYEAVYNQTLGDYKRLRERGQMGELIQGLSDEEFNMYAEAAAKMNALAAVYQQDTTLANALLGFKNSIGDLSRGLIGVDILSQFSMPFVKTPANVIERAIDYSPLGLVRNAFRTGKELKNGNFDQNRFANETARNILGTALMGGGAAFANAGGMEGAYSKDKDEKKVQKDAGMIEYGLKLPSGYETDIGWVPVVGSNLVASAAAMDAFNKGEGNAASNLATGLLAGGKAQLDQSMFQGMQRLFGGSGSYDSDKNLFSNMTDVFSSGLGQFVPSLLRQTGQVSDEYQRDLSNSNPDASLLFMDNYDINSLANTLPVLRNNALAPKVGTNGELLEENQGRNVGMKILEDMILPGKISKVEYSALNEEANRLKEATTSADAYMPSASRTLVDTDEHKLTNQEWVDYEQKYYKEMTDIGTQIIESDFYNNADDIEKTSMLKQAYDGIKYGVNHEYNGKEVSGAAKAYVEAGGGEDGVNAVLDYVKKGAIANQVSEQTGYGAKTKATKEIVEDIISGNTGAANQAIQNAQQNVKPYVDSAKELGIDATQYSQVKNYAGNSWSKVEPELPKLKGMGATNYSQYAHAKNYADTNGQSMDLQWFVNQTKALDTDKSGGVSQDELINEFNAKNMSESEVMKMWGMLALGLNGAETKQVPYIITRGKNKGKWGRH